MPKRHSNRSAKEKLEAAEAIIALGEKMRADACRAVMIPPPGSFVYGPYTEKASAFAVVRSGGGCLLLDNLTNAGMREVPSEPEFWAQYDILQVGDEIDEDMQRAMKKWQEQIWEDE